MSMDLRYHAAVFVVLMSPASGFAQSVRVDAGPFRVQDRETRTRSRRTIVGPQGTRTESTEGQETERDRPLSTSSRGRWEGTVQGVENTGLRVEKRIYLPGRAQPIVTSPQTKVTPNPDGSVTVGPEMTGGPGSVVEETENSQSHTPRVEVRVPK